MSFPKSIDLKGRMERRRVQVIAHRGASVAAPENTLAAFGQAMALGVDGLELDVQPTRDGAVVVLHDETLERTTSGEGYVFEQALDDLRTLEAGSWFNRAHPERARAEYLSQPIPTLAEVLALVAPHAVRLYVEIKVSERTPSGFEERVLEAVREHDIENRTVVLSFDPNTLRRVRQLAPAVATGVLFRELPADPIFLARTIGSTGIAPRVDRVTRELVEAAHRAGLVVATWTADTPELLRRLIAMGVDGIVTNVPEVLLRVLTEEAG